MTTTTTPTATNELIFADQHLQDVADMLKKEGMKIYIDNWKHSKSKPTYFHFTDGKNIGYCQTERFGGVRFSTVHKPCKEAGTGFAIQDYLETIFNPTIEDARKAFSIIPAGYPLATYQDKIKKFKDWEEYANSKLGPDSRSEY